MAIHHRPSSESPAGTDITTVGPSINASPTAGSPGSGNILAITAGAQIALNGTVLGGSSVVELYYTNHTAYQFNGSNWFGPITASGTGSAVSNPKPGAESPNGTFATIVGATINASQTAGVAGSGNTLAINTLGQITLNASGLGGSRVTALYYVNHTAYQQNINGDWFGPITASGVGSLVSSPLLSGATPYVFARDLRKNLGVSSNINWNTTNGLQGMYYLGASWVRVDVGRGVEVASNVTNFASLANAQNASWKPQLQVVISDYYSGRTSWSVWTPTQQNYLLAIAPVTYSDGTHVVGCIEGPNEIGWGANGGGSILPDTTTLLVNSGNNQISSSTVLQNCFVQWATVINTFVTAHAATFGRDMFPPKIEVISPTGLDYTGSLPGDLAGLNIAGLVDYGNFHAYAVNSALTFGCPSPSSVTGFANMRDEYTGFMLGEQNGGNLRMVISEFNANPNSSGGNYASDNISRAWCVAMGMLDHYALGGHRVSLYCLFETDQSSFGLFASNNPAAPTPIAKVVKNIQNLLSLSNDFTNAANWTDTGNFTPAYTGAGFSVSGVTFTSKAGSALICPKSNGTTMIFVWCEPHIEPVNGTFGATTTVPAGESVTVNFGGSHSYNVYDVSGNAGAATAVVNVSTTPFLSGTASSVTVTIYGSPMAIELTN